MLCILAKTMCGGTQLTMPFADAEEGAGVRTQILKVYIEIYNWTPPPGKIWTPWKCWTVLLHGISESYSLMIVFFEKAMITGLPLQNKLRTYKRTKKKNVRAFFSVSRAWTFPPLPPHPTAKPDENFLDPRMDIRYRGGRETISLHKNLLRCCQDLLTMFTFASFVNIEIKTVGWHIQQSGVVLKTV